MKLLRPHPRPFTAVVWLLDEPGKARRREFMADDYDAAKSILFAEFGDQIEFVLTDEGAARRPRRF